MTNMLWRFAERCGAQGVSFLVSLILARLLLPEDYGVVSLITIFTAILALFIDSGFKNALIQKRDADQLDFSTVFYFNVALGIGLYLVLFAAAPLLASFFGRDDMAVYLRVMSLTLILGGVNGVQSAVVARNMEFKKFFYSTLIGTLISAVIGVWMAFQGAGVWALIAQRLVNQTIDTFILWNTVRWRPSAEFSFRRLKPMFQYGSKLLGSSLLNSLTSNLTGLLIGKWYTPDLLAYYDKGRGIPNLVVNNLQLSIQSVLFPVLAAEQEQKEQVRAILKRSIELSVYVVGPFMTGIAVCAEPLVRVLYTEKWIAMVPYLRLWCVIFLFYLWHTANLQVIQALGRSDIYLKIELIKQGISLAGILIALPFGVLALLSSACAVTVLSLVVNAYPNGKLAGYGCIQQVRDVLPTIGLNVGMGAVLWGINRLPISDVLLLILDAAVGIGFYLAGSHLLRLEIWSYLIGLGKELFCRRRPQ